MQTGQVSAKIYQFVPRQRPAISEREMIARAFDMRADEAPVVDWEGGWYHDAAIAEETAERDTAAEAAEKVRPLFPH